MRKKIKYKDRRKINVNNKCPPSAIADIIKNIIEVTASDLIVYAILKLLKL